jgi:PTH1 family peptidyl-tRNA hydrolase
MKLIVGLGNPGRKYQGTRHNIGFDVLDEIARKFGRDKPSTKFDGEVVDAEFGGQKALLLWPHTFMNLSGASVGKARDFYRIETEEILVVCDDFNLPLAKLRYRPSGSSGGQKGLEDIIRRLGTDQFSRLRVGVGPVPENWDAAGFVLSKFNKNEGADIEQSVWRAADSVAVWATEGIDVCMNQFN